MAQCSKFFILAVPNQFIYPVWRQEPGFLTQRHRRLLTQKPIFSPASLILIWNKWQRSVKSYIISARLWLDYLHTSLFIPIYHTVVGSISLSENAKKSSNFHYKLWENHDLTVQPVITNVYSCGRNYGSCLFFVVM